MIRDQWETSGRSPHTAADSLLLVSPDMQQREELIGPSQAKEDLYLSQATNLSRRLTIETRAAETFFLPHMRVLE